MILEQPNTQEEADSESGVLWQTIHAAFSKNGHPRSLIVAEVDWVQIRDGDKKKYSGDPSLKGGGFQKYGGESFNKEPKVSVSIPESAIKSELVDAPNVPSE